MTRRSGDTIFVLQGDGALARIPEVPYETEDLLQRLIADYPELLGGEQIDPENPKRWLLVTREAGVPDDEGRGSRWSVDHLLLDQDARPTFVEVKRSHDPRIRREVVGQMLEYAANATRFWPADRIRSLAAEQHGGPDRLSQKLLDSGFVGPENPDDEDAVHEALEAYWRRVDENLREGEVRLLFVADHLPRELRRVIEFLNEHMTRVETLGVEIRQYAGESGDLKALVPRVLGQSERTRQQKHSGSTGSKPRLSRDELLQLCPDHVHGLYEEVLEDAERRGFEVRWNPKSFGIRLPGKPTCILYAYVPGVSGWEHASLSAYVRDVETDADKRALIGDLAALGWKPSGDYTANLALDRNSIEVAQRSLPAIWKLAEKSKAEYHGE